MRDGVRPPHALGLINGKSMPERSLFHRGGSEFASTPARPVRLSTTQKNDAERYQDEGEQGPDV